MCTFSIQTRTASTVCITEHESLKGTTRTHQIVSEHTSSTARQGPENVLASFKMPASRVLQLTTVSQPSPRPTAGIRILAALSCEIHI